MATVRITGIDVATGKERRVQAGDLIENFGGIVAGMVFRGAIPDVGSFPAESSRGVGDMYTITAVAAITDPEGTGQTLQPGDEVVWDGTQWAVIGNASLPNVEAALLGVLAADEDLLIRIGGALGALNVGAIGNILQVIDGGGAVPQVAWGAPVATAPKEVVDLTTQGALATVLPAHVNKIVLIAASATAILPDPTTLSLGDEVHVRHDSATVLAGGPPAVPIGLDAVAGTIEGASTGAGLPFAYINNNAYAGGVTLRVTEPDGGGTKDWKIVGDWFVDTDTLPF